MSVSMSSLLRGGTIVTAESVTCGHPDKVCDQISDAIVDAALAGDPRSRVAVETCGKAGILVFGEMTTEAVFDPADIARKVYADIGYNPDELAEVRVDVTRQSADIARINDPKDQGAGDQGIMVGYAVTNPDYEHMPTAIFLAHQLTRRLEEVRRNGTLSWLRPDGKSQVVLEDDRVKRVTIAAQHNPDIDLSDLRAQIHEHVIVPVVGDIDLEHCTINGTGAFVLGGFAADSGLTGRKIVVDAYGPNVEVGGGCFSGKDPTKVDRTAAYMARHIAKSIVAGGMAHEALVKLSFTINGREPDMLSVEAKGRANPTIDLERWVRDHFPLSPGEMIECLGLLKPEGWSYRETAAYGHFGRPQFPWEQVK